MTTGKPHIPVSYFTSVTSKTPKEISIDDIFNIIQSGQLKKEIEFIRATTDKTQRDKLKRELPAITVSGTFKNGHAKENLICHTGLLQIDIDAIVEPYQLKLLLTKDVFTYACFISPSGTGIKVIVKIPADKHNEYFEALNKYYFEKYKVNIDTKCRDIGRLMYLSYDEQLFINDNAMRFNSITHQVINTIEQLESQQIDITASYDDWLKIGFAFADAFGESGRQFYHRVSSINAEYTTQNCDKQFEECLRSKGNGITIKSFFQFAKNAGVTSLSQKKGELNSELPNEIDKGTNKKIKEPRKNQTSKFVMVENYLSKHFDFRYNEVANEIECKAKNETDFAPINENNIYRNLQHQNIRFSQSDLMVLLRSEFVTPYNPLKMYFETLPQWDEQTDHILQLCNFIKAKDQTRFNIQFKKMLVRCIACSLEVAFNKQAFILMGGQNGGKTTLSRWLCPESLKPYYAENISTDKDSLISLAENFIINLDELASLPRFEINQLKSMISKDEIKVRRPYDKKPTVAKRRANFFGSTNKDEFLTDETGSIRWLCFELVEILWDYKTKIDINIIWAQAYSLFKSGFKYELSGEEIAENEKINANHQVRTAELELIQTYFEQSEKGKTLSEALTATDIINKLKTAAITQIPLNVTNIGKALKILGYKQVSERVGESKIPRKVYWLRFVIPV